MGEGGSPVCLEDQSPTGPNGPTVIDALRAVLDSERAIGCELTGRRFDCGSVDGFFEAATFFYEARAKKSDALPQETGSSG